ncbi:MAG: FAD-binding protein [Clostridia bacterium]|nr:FAD-binding protein [Clostridia bacterium]
MSIKVLSDVKLALGESESRLVAIAEKALKRKAAYFAIKKKALDARDKNNIRYVYTIEFSAQPKVKKEENIETLPKEKFPHSPVLVVGSGPAGLFCALRLLARGIRPIVIERGERVEEREKSIRIFTDERRLNTDSNVQFGEGGAGTFSDGKLNTQTHSPLNLEVLKTFVKFGAPEEILWLSKPHVGSDKLKTVVKNMREYIFREGGEVRFSTKLTDLVVKDGAVTAAVITDLKTGEEQTLPVSALVLAVGHSARDTFQTLLSRGVSMRQKDFAVGVRIEHLQSKIGLSQYGEAYKKLPAAEYKLVSRGEERASFTFCMCPGGYVMPAASEESGVVTNGMSNYARDGMNANSALITQVTRADFLDDSPLAGMRFQQKLERAAYLAGGASYAAPVQLVGDFLRDRESSCFGEVTPTYAAGTSFADLRSVLPPPIVTALKSALTDMDRRLKGFANPEAVLTAVETRTSSPVRIERGEDMQSVNVKGLYPCGEGAGYAGGITSSAADGLRVADGVFLAFLNA